MFLNMWMLSDWLGKYETELNIDSETSSFTRFRIMMDNDSPKLDFSIPQTGNTLYLIYMAAPQPGIMCKNNIDTIFVHSKDPVSVINYISDFFEFYQTLEQSALSAIQNGKGIVDLLSILVKGLKHNLSLFDCTHQLIASVGNQGYTPDIEMLMNYCKEHKHLPLDYLQRMFSADTKNTSIKKEVFQIVNPTLKIRGTFRNIFLYNRFLGYLLCDEDIGPLSKGETQLLEWIGLLTERWYSKNYDRSEPVCKAKIYHQLLTDTSADTTQMLLYAETLSWLSDIPKYIACIFSKNATTNYLNFMLYFLTEQFPDQYPFLYQNCICIVNNTSAEPFHLFITKLERLLPQIEGYAGISPPFYELYEIKQGFQYARYAIDFGIKKAGRINYFSDCALNYIHTVLHEHLSADITDGKLSKLKAYDILHHTNYYITLYHYLLNERNQTKTSEVLNIHRNTLVQRIHRIYNILDTELDTPAQRLRFLFSYYAAEGIP